MKTLHTRIQVKYDSYANWSAENIIPLSGEVCVVVVPAEAGAVTQEPAVLFKVGDGASHFNELPFVSAKAADVYDWAKAAAKPTYTAEEISGLTDFIAGKIQDSDTQYKLEQDASDPHILKLYSKELGGEWSVAATITTADSVYDDTALQGRIAANETAISTLNGAGAGSVAKQVADAVARIVADAPEAYDTLKEISDWISGHAGDAAAMHSAIQTNTEDITALEALIGALPAGAASDTLVAYITEVAQSVSAAAASGKVDKIEGKGLSAEDFTTALKNKLEAIKMGALAEKDKVAEGDLETALATKLNGKADESALAGVAKTGNIGDLAQTEGEYIVLSCGSASTVL